MTSRPAQPLLAPRAVGPFRPAETIDEVIDRLDAAIDRARREQNRSGYFSVLYRNVTARVREGIQRGEFENGARMERLDVVFANRYLEALHQFQAGEQPSKCWQASFQAAGAWRPIVLQHLLLGMNAHINLDLGVAAATVCPRGALGELRNDFNIINAVLCAMLDDVQDRLAQVWPMMALLDRMGCRTDEAVMNFAIVRARDAAWSVATALAPLEGEDASQELARVDRRAALLARLIQCPGLTLSAVALLVRATELRQVHKVIDVLA